MPSQKAKSKNKYIKNSAFDENHFLADWTYKKGNILVLLTKIFLVFETVIKQLCSIVPELTEAKLGNL